MNFSSKQITTALALMGLMLATRFHHFGDTISLPDASLAALFFAGMWVRAWKFFCIAIDRSRTDRLSRDYSVWRE